MTAAMPSAPAPARSPLMWIVVGLMVAAVPLLMGGYPLYLATEACCWAIAAVALDLLIGYLGLTPLGTIAMWGVGGYATALLLRAGVPVPLCVLVATVVAAVYSLVTAPLALRAGGIFFLMVTLAFAQMVQALAEKWGWLGGTDGLTFTANIPTNLLYVACVLGLILTLWLLGRVVRSPFGRVVNAIRQNENRARALGYATFQYKLGTVILSSTFIGLAGALGALHRQIVTPTDLFWLQSAVLIIMVLLGGARTLWGPMLGAILYTLVQAAVSSRTELWAMLVGAALIILVLSGGTGIAGLLGRGRKA